MLRILPGYGSVYQIFNEQVNKPLCCDADPSWNGILNVVLIYCFLGLEYNLLTISVEFPLDRRLFSYCKIDGRGGNGPALTLLKSL